MYGTILKFPEFLKHGTCILNVTLNVLVAKVEAQTHSNLIYRKWIAATYKWMEFHLVIGSQLLHGKMYVHIAFLVENYGVSSQEKWCTGKIM